MLDRTTPLSHLPVGSRGRIAKLDIQGPLRRRLLALGLTTGELVRVTRVAPLGDPVEFHIRGYALSLRKSEAAQILVQHEQ